MKTIFEKSSGVDGVGICDCEFDCLEQFIPESLLRKDQIGLPQLSELEVLRHYKELSDRNFCSPSSIFSRPQIHLNNVDLPIPEGPIIETISPALTSKEKLFNSI